VPDIAPDLLGGWLGDMAATVAASTQTPPAMAVLTALAVVAAIVQRRFEVAPFADDYREPLPIWGMTVLGPGNRKTAVFKALTQVIVDIEKREGDRLRREISRVMAEREVIGKRIEALKMQAGKEDDANGRRRLQEQIAELKDSMPCEMFAPRIFTGDVTSERLQQLLVEQGERIAVLSDEGGIFSILGGAYSGGMASFDVFLQGHAGSAMRVDRAGRLAHLDRPALTMGLALQPDILQDAGKAKKFRGSGLMARFVYAVPKSTVGARDVRARIPIDEDARRRYEGGIQALYEGSERAVGAPRVLPFTDDARECWLELCEDIERRQGEGGRYAHMADWTSKLPGAAARIAALLALADGGNGIQAVPATAVQRAVKLARLLVPHAEAAFALMGASDNEADAHAVLAFLQRHQLQTVVRRELQKGMEGRFRQLERLLAAVKLLQDWHVLGPERKTSGTGRPSVFYEVNPRLYVDSPHSSH
jgi:putative DNA primase/helicase